MQTAQTARVPPDDSKGSIEACGPGDTRRLLLRPVLPRDDTLFEAMLRAQPADALRWRFHAAVRPSALWCQRMSRVDHHRQLALVVCATSGGREQLVADARYSLSDDRRGADCALIVDTRWHRRGVGRWLLGALRQAAVRAGVERLECEVLSDNRAMLGLAQCLGFTPMACEQQGRLLRLQCQLGNAAAGMAGSPITDGWSG